MVTKFYRKLCPTVSVPLSNGTCIKFPTEDGVVGFLKTNNEFLQGEFLTMMREQRSGISEISEEDYNRDFVEKKTQSAPSSQIWREELSKSTRAIRSVDPVERLGSEYVQAAVAVAETSDIRKNSAAGLAPVTGGTPAPIGTTLSSPAPDVVSEPKKVFVPTVGKRKFGKK